MDTLTGATLTITSVTGTQECWTVGDEIGRGGTAIVYGATSANEDRAVMKCLSGHRFPVNDALRERFGRESRHLMAIRHPNVIRALGTGVHSSQPVLLLERATTSLHHMLKESRQRPTWLVLKWMFDALEGVGCLHDAGLVHRDISPKNLLFLTDGRLVVADLGTVRHTADATVTGEGTPLGSLLYISPEQFDNAHEATSRDDVFSLGQIAWELLARRQPVGNAPPISKVRGDLPDGLAGFVERLRAHDPAERPATAGEALGTLKALISSSRRDQVSSVKRALHRMWKSRQLVAASALEQTVPRAGAALALLIRAIGPMRLAVPECLSLPPAGLRQGGLNTLLNSGSLRLSFEEHEGGGLTWRATWLFNRQTGRSILVDGMNEKVDLSPLLSLHGADPQLLEAFTDHAFARGAPCSHCGAPVSLHLDASPSPETGLCQVSRAATCLTEPASREGARCCRCGSEFVPIESSDEWGVYDAVGCSCGDYAFLGLFDEAPWRGKPRLTFENVECLETSLDEWGPESGPALK